MGSSHSIPADATPAAAVDEHAGVVVLTNRILWECITACMSGYPLAVYNFYRIHKFRVPMQLTYDKNLGYFKCSLPHLAITANDCEMLRVLHRLSRLPEHQTDVKLLFVRAMRCAVLYKNVEALECLNKLSSEDGDGIEQDFDWKSWGPRLANFASMQANPDLRVVEWLYTHLPPPARAYPRRLRDIRFNAARGNLDVVRCILAHKPAISEDVMDAAAQGGHLHVLQYLYEHSSKRCRRTAVDFAAGAGNLDIVKFIVENQTRENSVKAINAAAANGRLEVVQYLIENKVRLEAPRVIDFAARSGHLDVVTYLHELRPRGWCSVHAMDGAAANGHLAVVEFLFEHRREGCSPAALDGAARNGHLDVVTYLHGKYAALKCSMDAMDGTAAGGHLEVLAFLYVNHLGGCSAKGMDEAAGNGHLEIVQLLHERSAAGCSTNAMDRAAANGHLEIVQFLHHNRSEGCTTSAMHLAASNPRRANPQRYTDIVRFLFEHRPADCDLLAALRAAMHCDYIGVIQFLHSHLQEGESVYPALVGSPGINRDAINFLLENQEKEPTRLLRRAVENREERLVCRVVSSASRRALPMDELLDAKALALTLNLPLIVMIINQVIAYEAKRAA